MEMEQIDKANEILSKISWAEEFIRKTRDEEKRDICLLNDDLRESVLDCVRRYIKKKEKELKLL